MGLSDGAMLSIGGYDAIEETAVTDIWRLSKAFNPGVEIDTWDLIGNLREVWS